MSEEVKLMPTILSRLPEKSNHPCWDALMSMSPPSSKQEIWKYTRTGRITQHAWQLTEKRRAESSSVMKGMIGCIKRSN